MDLAQARTLWLRPQGGLQYTFLLSVTGKFGLVILESIEKQRFLKSPYRRLPPEALGSIINRGVFWWLNGLFLKGYRSILGMPDLYPTDPDLSSKHLRQRIKVAWDENSTSRRSLMFVTMKCFSGTLFSAVLSRLVVIVLKFCQPLLIQQAVSAVQAPETLENVNISRALIGATVLIYVGLALMTAQYTHRIYRTMTMIRGALTCLIYDKTLMLDPDIANDSAVVTLMSTDIERIMQGLERFDSLWASPIEIGVALYLLERELGLACLAPVVLTLFTTSGSFIIGRYSASRQKKWVQASQERVSATASAIHAIKSIKMLGYQEVVTSDLQKLRMEEIEHGRGYRKMNVLANTVSNSSLFISAPLTFLTYVLIGKKDGNYQLDITTAFTALSLISLLSRPLQNFAFAVPLFTASLGCYARLEEYLKRPNHKHGLEKNSSNIEERGSDIELHDLHQGHTTSKSSIAINVSDATFSFTSSGSIGLRNISLNVPRNKLIVVVGTVGSGKSTLLRAFADQLNLVSGSIDVKVQDVGYCAQTSWLPNTSIRDAILGPNDFEETWYSSVIHACMLDLDIAQLDQGEQTKIGSEGAALSGGQKQRLVSSTMIKGRRRYTD